MGVAALKLAGVVNKNRRGRKNFRARFARGMFSTLLDEILDTPLEYSWSTLRSGRYSVITANIMIKALQLVVNNGSPY